jgi:poly(A) polymerase
MGTPKNRPFLFPDPLKPLLSGLIKEGIPLYAVGGMVRDQLLGRGSKDLDILVMAHGKAHKLLEKAQSFGLRSFPLDVDRGIFRGIYQGWIVDFTEPRAPTLEEDLAARDFTINSIAVTIDEAGINHGAEVIDPTGGLKDLNQRLIRTVRPENIIEDPLRALRCYRFSLKLGFKVEQSTETLVEEGLDRLGKVTGERKSEELSIIFSHPLSNTLWHRLARRGVITKIFPTLGVCRGEATGKWYGTDLLFHQIGVLKGIEMVILAIPSLFPHHKQELQTLVGSRVEGGWSQGALLKLASLLHDIGKPSCRREKGDKVVFWGHDRSGEALVEEVVEELKLGRSASNALKTHVREHMRMHLLAQGEEVSTRAKGRFFRDMGNVSPLTPLLSLADAWASSGDVGLLTLLPFVEDVISFYYNCYLQQGEPMKPLLNGHRVMEILGLSPGPAVGKAMDMLLEAQLEGRISNKEDAESWLREIKGNLDV